MRVGPVGIVNGTFGNRPHCIYRGFCLQGCKVNAKASPYVTHLPDALAHGVEIRADSMAVAVETRRREAARPASPTREATGGALPARRARWRSRLLDRDAAPAAALHQRALPQRPRQRRRPGRPLRDGAGRLADRAAASRGAADVQGAAAGDLLRAVLRDRRGARLRARVLDPDRRPAADRLGRARARRGPLGAALREYMRDYNHWYDDRRASTSCCRRRRTASRLPRRPTATGCRSRASTTRVRERPGEHRYAKRDAARDPGGRRRQDVLTIDRYAHLVGGCTHGHARRENSVVDADHRVWGCRTCSSPTAA